MCVHVLPWNIIEINRETHLQVCVDGDLCGFLSYASGGGGHLYNGKNGA